MGPVAYVIAILGCADGSATCQPVATIPTQYENKAACSAATGANSDFDFPTLIAECRTTRARPAAESKEPRPSASVMTLEG